MRDVAEPRKKAATYAELEAVSPFLVAEIIDGDLVTHPRPLMGHGSAASVLNGELFGVFQKRGGGPGGWHFVTEPELHFGPQIVVPDLAGWRKERFAVKSDEPFTTIPPDWACEILSPSTERYDRGAKQGIYAEAGVSFLWLLDPRKRTLESFSAAAGRWLLTGVFKDGDTVSAPPFEALSLALDSLWLAQAPEGEPDSDNSTPMTKD